MNLPASFAFCAIDERLDRSNIAGLNSCFVNQFQDIGCTQLTRDVVSQQIGVAFFCEVFIFGCVLCCWVNFLYVDASWIHVGIQSHGKTRLQLNVVLISGQIEGLLENLIFGSTSGLHGEYLLVSCFYQRIIQVVVTL